MLDWMSGYAQAEQLYQRALGLEQHLGAEHPELARPLLGLAFCDVFVAPASVAGSPEFIELICA
jgi:hypothetical protein